MISTLGKERVVSKHPDLIKKGKDGGWLRQEFLVKNCSGNWRVATGKRKRPPQTIDEWLEGSDKRQKALSKEIVVYKAKLAESKLRYELQEVAKQMLLLKAKKDAMA
tara:strand:+ start:1130 stop:1450 length:321 start_codon:yes stop_codon:yes gene_type:complete